MRHKQAPRREIDGDAIYNNKQVAKFINYLMRDGKKTVAQNVLYAAFNLITKKELDPIATFEKALDSVGPKQEVKAKRVGGASYQIPMEVRPERRASLAMKWIVESARKRSNKDYKIFEEKLAAELMDAASEQGEAIKKRDSVLRMAQANRAFSHFKW
ncbi:MAG: 30S ribosomal protein S7 [Candidatus Levybacteria bacterium RIFCSPLOWO2_01_FULL_39_24]|nr:MAG: 30S ribosomal protein S7 [Candidatus Levybacteria bacterium RIFCSPHIGHO2_01_FULL_40_16]OGH27838.1 MAG: 30S ribosomal protein S7 [Candidatus Levybacteria bacterium RIFCSPHIGHO2_12_FULL_39_9]OGH45910.1 MAG: 30S ribosomal protein S7 [Candidatus Levybacteria bacterium RIFCSPLOWO2_01_FULL_39_24]